MANLWYVGDKPKISATFMDLNGALVDPDDVIFKVRKPDCAVTAFTYGIDAAVVRDALGVYHFLIDLTQPGNWFYAFQGTGARQVAREGTIFVQPTNF